jgi:hypothetical protein
LSGEEVNACDSTSDGTGRTRGRGDVVGGDDKLVRGRERLERGGSAGCRVGQDAAGKVVGLQRQQLQALGAERRREQARRAPRRLLLAAHDRRLHRRRVQIAGAHVAVIVEAGATKVAGVVKVAVGELVVGVLVRIVGERRHVFGLKLGGGDVDTLRLGRLGLAKRVGKAGVIGAGQRVVVAHATLDVVEVGGDRDLAASRLVHIDQVIDAGQVVDVKVVVERQLKLVNVLLGQRNRRQLRNDGVLGQINDARSERLR